MTATQPRKGNAKSTTTTPAKAAAKAPTKVEPAKRVSLPNAERRNETTHEDGAAAVAGWACKACGSAKGTRCLAATGEPTSYVHSDRMKKLEASKQAPAKATAKRASKAAK